MEWVRGVRWKGLVKGTLLGLGVTLVTSICVERVVAWDEVIIAFMCWPTKQLPQGCQRKAALGNGDNCHDNKDKVDALVGLNQLQQLRDSLAVAERT